MGYLGGRTEAGVGWTFSRTSRLSVPSTFAPHSSAAQRIRRSFQDRQRRRPDHSPGPGAGCHAPSTLSRSDTGRRAEAPSAACRAGFHRSTQKGRQCRQAPCRRLGGIL